MIKSIKLRDFRGIKTGVIEGFRKINLLVGPNNSGKSAVLEAIYLACTASRPARMIDEKEKSDPYDTTVAEHDLTGDHPMRRVWAKHGYGLEQNGLGEWDTGQIKVHQKNRETRLPDFSLTPAGLFAQGEERYTALFGLESQDRTQQPYETRLAEIQHRIVTLRQELETPHRPGIAGTGEEQERSRNQEVEKLQRGIEGAESEKGDLEKAEGKRGERIKFLADRLMTEGLPGFSQSRLVYCWHPNLSHNYKGDAAWIVKGEQIPAAKHTVLYDLAKVTGHLPLEFVRENFFQKPERLQKLNASFDHIFGLEQCAIQFQSAPGDNNLSQAWVAHQGQSFVPIDAFGDGARSVFKLLVALHVLVDTVSEEEAGLLIWEEPELFQNPQTLGRLLKEVVTLVNPKPIQVFIASHSLEAPAHLVRLVRQEHLPEHDLLVFRTRLYQGKLLSVGFDHGDAKAWINMKKDLRTPSGDVDSPLTFQMEVFDDGFDRD